MTTLPAPLRRQLERAAQDARNVAEAGARKALEALAVHEPDPYRHMDEAQRTHRRQLRAQAKQLGDGESQTRRGAYEIKHLVEKLAYDQWHRLLFARFLLENNLLISPEHGVSVSLDDCEELAPSLGLKDAWAVAARFAAVELPEIFRADDPAGGVELPVEDRKGLIQLVTGLPVAVFTASDSLGWCYQFWQAERKDQVNAAGNKIGADELPSVTQLFTEDYMVDFLLDNTLGAWWAGKKVSSNQLSVISYPTEEDARKACALPGCPWKYLRFVKASATTDHCSLTTDYWLPAAGTFSGWPKTAKELKCLDPCMGSGHFEVAMFERLVALRLAEEKLDEAAAVAAVIRDNLFGLEIDPRCTQIAAFNLALAAWRRVGHCKLPAMNLACSGLAPNAKLEDWLKLADSQPSAIDSQPSDRLRSGMTRLYELFKQAPVLGSLINPRAEEGDLLVAAFHELQPLLEKALAQEADSANPHSAIPNPQFHEMAVTARGLAKAAEILAGQFTLVATNVPYLGRGKQDDVLKEFCDSFHPESKAGLATTFTERCLSFAQQGCTTVLVTPENWLSLSSYKTLREKFIRTAEWNFLVRLGPGAFQTPMWDFNTILLGLTTRAANKESLFLGVDGSEGQDTEDKANLLNNNNALAVPQMAQLTNPDVRIGLSIQGSESLLSNWASSFAGLGTGDFSHYGRCFWEFGRKLDGWAFYQTTVESPTEWSGREQMVAWDFSIERVRGMLPQEREQIHNQDQSGQQAWNKSGIAVGLMGELKPTLFTGERYDKALAAIIPDKPDMLPAMWAFCSDPAFNKAVRQLDQNLFVGNGILVKVSFDLAHWQVVAAEKYPQGLPKPFSSDPTQWLFNGHPGGADQPLHVAVARLLGYQWPRQTGSSFPDCPALAPDGLETLADDDGIVPISPAKGEGPAAERLRELLARAYGKDWSSTQQEELLASLNPQPATLEDWLRNGFFEQHCALFHHRPFIWHVWDGLKNGFSALVNYHKLTRANLEKLTFAYLGDWIRRQQAAVAAEEAGSDAKLQAAKQLQATLKLILEGEPPYDIFIRWKPLSQQAIGWHPDLNDGVRMNIRPFATADILRKRVKIKWDKDRGKEPQRDKAEYPWFWGWDEAKQDFAGGREFTGDRWNDCHYTGEFKQKARK